MHLRYHSQEIPPHSELHLSVWCDKAHSQGSGGSGGRGRDSKGGNSNNNRDSSDNRGSGSEAEVKDGVYNSVNKESLEKLR